MKVGLIDTHLCVSGNRTQVRTWDAYNLNGHPSGQLLSPRPYFQNTL